MRSAELSTVMVSMLLAVQPAASAESAAARPHEGPYAAIGNMLSDDKAKSRFFGLLKKSESAACPRIKVPAQRWPAHALKAAPAQRWPAHSCSAALPAHAQWFQCWATCLLSADTIWC